MSTGVMYPCATCDRKLTAHNRRPPVPVLPKVALFIAVLAPLTSKSFLADSIHASRDINFNVLFRSAFHRIMKPPCPHSMAWSASFQTYEVCTSLLSR